MLSETLLRRCGGLALCSLSIWLCACAGVTLHNEPRAKLATDAKQGYIDAKVTEVTETDRKNLEFLLGEEFKVVRENYALQVDFATLEIAANGTPIGRTSVEASLRVKELGFDSTRDLRSIFKDRAKRDAARRSIRTMAKVFDKAGVPLPECDSLPQQLDLPASVSPDNQALLKSLFPQHVAFCKTLTAASLMQKGLLPRAYGEWSDAKAALDEQMAESAKAALALKKASQAYEAKAQELVALKLTGENLKHGLISHAAALAKALNDAKKLNLGLEGDETVDALIELLTAAAGSEVTPLSPSVARAAIVAKEIPSLAADLADLEAGKSAPPVSGLLLALRHQSLLAQAAKKRVALAEERVDILKTRSDAYIAEAEKWRGYADAICNHAMLSTGAKHPGEDCDKFSVDTDGKCTMADQPVQNCVLAQPWKARLRAPQAPDTKREIYKAVTSYLQAIALQAAPTEQRFREIDVRHRETLLAKESALEAWDNLVSLPLEQLDAFYQAGLKPNEVADLIVKALGFTAIAIGIAK
jgi:hypothetical protein